MGGSVSMIDGHIDGPVTDREKLWELIRNIRLVCSERDCSICEHNDYDIECFIHMILDHLIANGVVVREKGEWKYYRKQGIAVCTSCSFERKLDDNFGRAVACPNCGADMRKGENG